MSVSHTKADLALDYAEFGFCVFPVGADCKPGRLAWPGTSSGFIGVHDATNDRELVSAYWSAYPSANISAACGRRTGAFVLDVDVKDSAGVGYDGIRDLSKLQGRFGALSKTWRSSTPSGGEHWWFRQPARQLSNRVHIRVVEEDGAEVKTGLDIRTCGGAAPLPPSAKPNGAYAWVRHPFATELADAPGWLLDVIDPPLPPRAPMQPIRVQSLDRTARYVEQAVNNECGELACMGARSGRNLRLFQAAASLGEFVGAGLLSQAIVEDALQRAAQDCGLLREDGLHSIRATITSGMRRGLQSPREVIR
jgi:putative DNA primase/helicase